MLGELAEKASTAEISFPSNQLGDTAKAIGDATGFTATYENVEALNSGIDTAKSVATYGGAAAGATAGATIGGAVAGANTISNKSGGFVERLQAERAAAQGIDIQRG